MMGLKNIARRFLGDEGGAILVEMTILTPFMILLSAGVFEFSNVMHTRLLVEAGITDAARYYARCRHTDATAAGCEATAKTLATTKANGSPRVTGWDSSEVTLTESTTSVSVVDANTGETNYRSNSGVVRTVRVATTMPYPNSSLLAFIGIQSLNITVYNEQRVMGW